ncbi:unnamed protein product [Echinostoma caproni]|uniref:Amidohydro-rel domain-containing protein n=1 Tax=Echinostoma caproni TaxID=27848 RepID=A0A3P8L7K0_9TREM|nr:unnamed protein product [Echinostoma caproni]
MTGLYPSKGRINPGSDADLVFWPVGSQQHSGSGRPIAVLLRGQVMAREGKLAHQTVDNNPPVTIERQSVPDEEPRPHGAYLDVRPFPAAVYGPVHATDRLRKRHQYVKNRGPWAMGALNDELTTDKTTADPTKGDHTSPVPSASAVATDKQRITQTITTDSPSVRMVHGHRDLHASGFSLSGAQIDDNQPLRSGIRTSQPPGGVSRNPLW